jgi:ankyrin repeat protein
MIEEMRATPDTREGKRRERLASKTAAGFMLASLLACSTSAPPKTTPAAAKAVSLPGFRVSVPETAGWQSAVEPSIRAVTFSKKWGGFGRWLTDEQRRSELIVTAFQVPIGHWSVTGEELRSFLKGEYLLSVASRQPGTWKSVELAGRTLQFMKSDEFIDGTEESTGLECLNDAPLFKESNLYGLYFPPDLERAHRYFEIYIRTTYIDSILHLHKDQDMPALEAVLRSLETVGPFEDMPGPSGALARAILAGDQEAANKAVGEGADVNAKLSDWPPLEIAAWCDRRDIAARLVRNESLAGIFSDEPALTPFLLALVAGRPEIAAALVDRGVRVEKSAEEQGHAPLAIAAAFADPGLVSRLLEKGAAVDVRTASGRTPLMLACESGSLESVKALVEAGAGLDLEAADGGTALLTAVDWGRREIMRLLLERGADINIQDVEGWSPLLVAIFQGDAALVDELVAGGADVDANVYATGETALVQALRSDNFEIARALIDAGANVNLRKDGQWTPLMVAVSKDRSDLVALMIEQGAELNAASDDQQTALKIAQSNGLTAMAGLLIKAGAKK